MTFNKFINLMPYILAILFVIGIDQFTKSWILDYFAEQHDAIHFLPFLDFVLVWNRGVSWGMFNNAGEFNALIFSLISAIISIVLIIWLWRAPNKLTRWALSLIIGGAIGNLIDRLNFAGVVDFIYFHWHQYTFPAFNIADAAITVGVGLMILENWINRKGEYKNAA